MDALREWMGSDPGRYHGGHMDALREWMGSDLDVIMVGTWMLCESTETATKKRRITRENAVETALPA